MSIYRKTQNNVFVNSSNLWEKCMAADVPLNEACEFQWHTGEGSVKFDPLTMKRIKNMTKMTTMCIKYDLSERWMRSLIDMDITDSSAKQLSKCNYLESLVFRLVNQIEGEFDDIMKGITLQY